jgi:hypothetical protein
MKIRKSAVWFSFSTLVLVPLVGCWWSNSSSYTPVTTQGQSGKVVQGAVKGSTVWADSLVSGTRGVIDTGEQSTQTTTDSNGNFTLPVQPTYKYVITSMGGTDTITGQPATTLLAPAGSISVSSLTTLVALDTTGKLASIINALLPAGTTYDSDLSATGALSPAALILISSIQTAVTTLNQAIQDAATKSGSTLTSQQQNDINLTVYSQIAATFSGLSAASLSDTQSLATNLQTALTAAISTIQTNNSNITISNGSTIAASIANNSVAVSANVVGNATGNIALQGVTATNVQSVPVTASTSTTVTETTVMTTSNIALVNNTTTTQSTTAAASTTATSTPSTYSPPVIAVINNPTIIGYELQVNASNSAWAVSTLQITFSDDMVATASGTSTFANSVLNPANYQFSQGGCTPTSYSAKVVSLSCSQDLTPGAFTIEIYQSSSTTGVQASATSLGLSVNNTKIFTLPTTTGSTGGSSLSLF